jgi:hypothetical protein
MNVIPLGVAFQATRELAQSALPDAPTVADDPPRHTATARHTVAASLRWAANRIEGRSTAERVIRGAACM